MVICFSERKHRHLIETSLALLKQACVPTTFWDEAVTTASFLINRMPTPLLANQSPYEILFKRLPTNNFLKTFGCLCYPHLRAYRSHKLDYRSEKCVFLGYSSMHIGYRCLYLTTNKIYISHDVLFDERVFPFSQNSIFVSPPDNAGILGPCPIIITPTEPTLNPISPISITNPITPADLCSFPRTDDSPSIVDSIPINT